MPRKPIVKKQQITVVVNGLAIKVSMTPPHGSRASWYAYWNGLVASKSTGQSDFPEAVKAVEDMLRNGGERSTVQDMLLSDDEFIEIQRRHYGKKTDPAAQKRSQKSLRECLDAVSAFSRISGLSSISQATPDDCERFQQEALKLPRNWRVQYADNDRSRKRRQELAQIKGLSSNTVVKWSVALQAAFERASRNAGKKCVRGVVPESKLLNENPWRQFTWIEGAEKPLRQFDHSELLALLDYFETNYPNITVATAFIKVMLWSWARRDEISSLSWEQERRVGTECHFQSTGKWGVTKWFRIPEKLRDELESLRTSSSFVFSCFPEQLRAFYNQRDGRAAARVRADFAPYNLGEWVYRRIKDWSATLPNGTAYLHVFRKTSLQYALSAEHLQQSVAGDASVSAAVMMQSYARVADEELRQKSNRTFQRIRRSLSVEVSGRYGWELKKSDQILERLDQARQKGDWQAVARLAQELAGQAAQAT